MQTLQDIIKPHLNSDKSIKILNSHLEVETTITYQTLYLRAQMIAAYFKMHHYQEGDLVIICCSNHTEFLIAFLGCLLAGIVAVPCYPPFNYGATEKLIHIIKETNPKLILFDKKTQKLFNLFKLRNKLFFNKIIQAVLGKNVDKKILNQVNFLDIPCKTVEKIKTKHYQMATAFTADNLALLQYTSGSTCAPKGVALTHGNLINNIEAMVKMTSLTNASKVFSWLPFYHDMGLIGNILTPLYKGCDLYLMSPFDFLKKPTQWLKAISDFKITHTSGPNFAYDLCSHYADNLPADLDFSSWQIAICGAEPIRFDTIKKFNEIFSKYKFNLKTFTPCYGLAETCVFATHNDQQELLYLSISKNKLNHNIVDLSDDALDKYNIVSVCRAFEGEKIYIVNPHNHTVLSEMQIGEICITSPSVGQGYWNNPESDHYFKVKIADETYLRTGDLGFLYKNHLFVTGRLKDLIIKCGKKHYPHDIELEAEDAHPAIRKGCTVAIGISDMNEEEHVIVFAEVKKDTSKKHYEEVKRSVIDAVLNSEQLHVDDVVLLPYKGVYKTTSGKVQRQKMKKAYLSNLIKRLDK